MVVDLRAAVGEITDDTRRGTVGMANDGRRGLRRTSHTAPRGPASHLAAFFGGHTVERRLPPAWQAIVDLDAPRRHAVVADASAGNLLVQPLEIRIRERVELALVETGEPFHAVFGDVGRQAGPVGAQASVTDGQQ